MSAETMPVPGANRSLQGPTLEYEARVSSAFIAPTVIASATRAGLTLHVETLELPAAATTVIPSAITPFTAASSGIETVSLPRLMLTTAGWPGRWSAMIQFNPAMTSEVKAAPLQSNTFTGTSVTALATPEMVPPRVPDTWVP